MSHLKKIVLSTGFAVGVLVGVYLVYVTIRRAFGQPWKVALDPRDLPKLFLS